MFFGAIPQFDSVVAGVAGRIADFRAVVGVGGTVSGDVALGG